MRDARRALTKEERQRLVASVITRKRVGTQLELLDALAKAGCTVTQATVSRDIRELGLRKHEDELGRLRYVLPDRAVGDPRASLERVLAQFGRRATAAQNIVVVHCELGTAPAIARALDALEHRLVVGTLAGDDTCLVVTASAANARRLARELSDSLDRA